MPKRRRGRVRPWRRRLWGIAFQGARDEGAMLIGSAWDKARPETYPGEPTRLLLFVSRSYARRWAATKQAQYAARPDSCRFWRFRAVPVIESARVRLVRVRKGKS